MALARVQATAKVEAGSGTLTITLTTPATLGNAVIVPTLAASSGNPLPSDCTDNYGNPYVRTAGHQSGTAVGVAQFVCPKVLATGTPFTISLTVHRNTVAQAIEVSGVGDGLALDGVASASGSSTAPASGSTAALVASEVFVVGALSTSAAQASITVASVSPSWTQELESLSNVFTAGEVDSRLLTGASGTATSISWTLATSTSWIAHVVAYRATTATSGLTRVQATAKLSSGSANSHTLTWSTAPTVGNGIIVPIAGFRGDSGPMPQTVTDNQGHTFQQAVVSVSTGHAGIRTGIYYCPKLVTVAGAYTVTITYSSAVNGLLACCGLEVSGVGAGLNVATTTALGSTATTTPSTGTSLASPVADLFDVAILSRGGGPSAITVESVSPAWTQEFEELPFTNASGEADSRGRTSQVGVTQSCSWTLGSANHWTAALAALTATTTVAAPTAVATAQTYVWGPL